MSVFRPVLSGCLVAAAITFSGFAVPKMAIAQDLNTLDRHLDSQRWNRLQDHQNQTRTMGPRSQQTRPSKNLAKCTENHVPRGDYRRMEAEYHKKRRAEGKRNADRWSRQQADAWYQRLKARGVCR
ncbi:hypothetical protein FPY71_09490 [Aureimonas fodinaquatilis]|uniref:Uncharacterized protein n=1 Tax=Aureimonas fodinaquatilis TaxID=2565783 RepID=A0A5B0DZR8_9HYPH|nr:hypothetical protein [Aureimonas fodinaquatilis]KAA0970709.1 hypothetical protein FPY71_09490 [Aureimonas fodinaquatilis]